jgi:hypothetical protein
MNLHDFFEGIMQVQQESQNPEHNKSIKYRFSGHETFPCRYAWLPKAFKALVSDSKALANDDHAMVVLGVGKNMVRAIRFWVQAVGVAKVGVDGAYDPTPFGTEIFSEDGFDPFLEDIRTLWLIHWQLSANINDPLFAWDYLLNRWQHPDFSRSKVLEIFRRESERIGRTLSAVTLGGHFDTFLHTYVPTRGRKGEIQEDNLDCPLVELELIQKVGERKTDNSGKREHLYAFRYEEKPEITAELFIYCLSDYWHKHYPSETTLTFRDLSIAHGSPGQIFKIPEWNIRERLDSIEADSKGAFIYQETASLQQIIRTKHNDRNLLADIYRMEFANV